MTDQLGHRMHALREHIDASYDTAQGFVGLQKRIRRRRVAKGVAGAGAVLALALLAWRATPASDALRTEDGSLATRLSPETELRVESDAAEQVELALDRGRGHFEVTRNPKRKYRVRAGVVTVEVLGTAFDVERHAQDAHVRVEHGLVRVRWPNGEALLHAGEQGTFPPAQSEHAPVLEPPVVEPPVVAPPSVVEKKPAREDGWRVLARAGKHREAFGSLGERKVDDLDGLLLAADAARLSGHPRQASQHLERLVRKYPESASAPLAAFTLGRLQLHELHDPARAARSFARAYALDPKGALAEDALAREAEAQRGAGDTERAAELARRYLALYPRGARRAEMATYLAR